MSKSSTDNKFCLPIINESKTDITRIIKEASSSYRYLEIWLDYVKDLDSSWLSSLICKYPNRLALVFRRKDLKPMRLDHLTRLEILKSLDKKSALVDLDVTVQGEDITAIKKSRIKLKTILSYHNYSFTPSDSELRSITKKMLELNPYISKVSTFCKTQKDSLRLLSLLLELRESGQRFIILGMGPHGVITRIFGTIWGNEMAFAPQSASAASAPGQLTLDDLQSVLKVLE